MILEKVKNTVKKHNLIGKHDKVLVAVSGGPDSLSLLYLLNSLKKELKITLHVAHLDHMLRSDSYKDAEFVRSLAGKLKLPISATQINVKVLAKRGPSEEIARNARLGFLFKVARRIKADKIALGHNFDDQAETVLMRILRGAGLYGLSGILAKRKISGYTIIRPLIEVRRKEIDGYLRKKKLKGRIDISNLQDIYLRNKIRNKLLPLLEKEYNRNIKEVLANMAESAACDYNYLSRVSNRLMRRAKNKVSIGKLLKLHPAIQRLIFRHYFAKLKGDSRSLNFVHIKEIEDLVLCRPKNSIVDLPKGISVIKNNNSLSFYRR